ncbi:hypothetical protein [Methylobacterium gnaphalii]|uniref:Uncharacterized protein n=1 Tax=Methylobacterium gnaphalii TaxID=1010610 RepID=A0A512JPB4_9HYPH|nr:hypothetical protein [Methylobacterium gnaphalii]GEP11779.1 hypothetical protein MGN01_36240 [Methylobacterium gnaphalii]GJD69456.1 hypothetical protein MMMDOFMJ_2387 [Methylobacterium gnaphalii]GLS49586.1 hypothetical protein GCM10007885_24350 [Methylobacterium gnaphalii]
MPRKIREIQPAPEATKKAPSGFGRETEQERYEIAMRAPRSRKLLDIFSTLATGHLPWGVRFPYRLTGDGDHQWHLCCGHSLNYDRMQSLVAAGLLEINRDSDLQVDFAVITPAGRLWLNLNWSGRPKPPRPPSERPMRARDASEEWSSRSPVDVDDESNALPF